MKSILFLLGVFFIFNCNAQDTYDIVEKPPEFPGGEVAMQKFLANEIVYPKEAIENEIQGRVFVKFMVTKTGLIQDLKVLRGVSDLLDKEAKRAILAMPKWIPGEQNGKKVNVWYTLPVMFRLG